MIIQPADIGACRFAHHAMATEFEIFCVLADAEYAQQAALAAFDLLDRLENELSRFIPNSDISRINHLAPGERARVSRWTMECLQIAREAYAETAGAFDISLGTGLDRLQLSPGDFTVQPTIPGISLDLGGIGKGYAVDRMAEVLDEWDVHQALIHGGGSSVLALDPPTGLDGWPLTVGDRSVEARRRAFSASGIRIQGEHIRDPRTGQPAATRTAAWVSLELDGRPSPSAVAEAYSTAFMILPASEVQEICAKHAGLEAWLLEATTSTEAPPSTEATTSIQVTTSIEAATSISGADPLVRGRPPGRPVGAL